MKTVDKLAQKYALNINQIRGPVKSNNLDFKNLNKGFYDELEKNDVKIKKDQKELKKLKDVSLKEFIYTNKEIPEKWRKKINYEDDLLNIMIKDKDILTYIGTSTKDENINMKSYSDRRDSFPNIKSFSIDKEKNFPNITSSYNTKRILDKNISQKDSVNNIKNIFGSEISKKNTITEEYDNKSISKFSKRYKDKNRTQLTDKAINNILEDFKTAYPIKEKLQQLYTKTNYYNTSTNLGSDNGNNDNKYSTNGITMNNTLKNTSNMHNLTLTNTNNFFSSIKNQQQFKRKNVFRQNVFNNLIPSKTYSMAKSIPNKRKLKYDNKARPYFGSDYQSFIKKVEINNPIINKNLESINYYGPYFSHCPPCNNRNLDFYKNLEINQCLDIIHHIKKMRMKKTILDIKNSTSSMPNMESEIDMQSLQSNENNK